MHFLQVGGEAVFESHTVKRRAAGQAIAIGVFVAVCALLYALANLAPSAFFEAYIPFSRAVSGSLAFLFSFAPVSVAELLLYLLAAFFLIYLVWSVVCAFTRTGGGWIMVRYGMDALFSAVFLVFIFVAAWGLNYIAPPLDQRLGLDVRERPEEALVATTRWTLELVKAEAGSVKRGADGSMDGGGFGELAKKMPAAFKALEAQNDVFAGGGASPPKRILNWLPFTYMGISGIYSPFTGECNVNPDSVDAYLPYTMAHEMGHRYGFAAENDANFIAFKACMASPDPEVRYSGAALALFQCMAAMSDMDALDAIRAEIPQVLWDDIAASQKKQDELELDPALAEAASSFSSDANDLYLKTVGLEDGVKSYGRVVDLLVAEYVRLFGETSLY